MHICYATKYLKVSQIRLAPEIQLMRGHLVSDPVLDVDGLHPIEFGYALLFQHCPCRVDNRPVFPLFRCVFEVELSPNSLLLQITVELAGKILLSAIRLQALDLPLCFPFN